MHYKQTRNALDGLDNCSIFSPWLAIGALSVRHVAEQLVRFEQEYLSNESTEWFLFELWWREFFNWRAQVDGLQLFLPTGWLDKSGFAPLNHDNMPAGVRAIPTTP